MANLNSLKPLTARAMAVWQFVHAYQVDSGGISPSFIVIAHGTDIASKSGVSKALDGLEKAGVVRRLRNRARAIEVLAPPPVSSLPDGTPLYFVPAPGAARFRSDNLRPASIPISPAEIEGMFDYMEAARVARVFRGENWPFREHTTLADVDREVRGR